MRNFNRSYGLALVAGIFCFLLGCATGGKESGADLFWKENSEEAEKYYVLVPAPDEEVVDFLVEAHQDSIQTILHAIRRRIDSSQELEETLNFLEAYEWEKLFRAEAGQGEHLKRMKPEDALYFFKYRHPDSILEDRGYLVLRDGRIVFREPHWEEADREALSESGIPFPYFIDELGNRE